MLRTASFCSSYVFNACKSWVTHESALEKTLQDYGGLFAKVAQMQALRTPESSAFDDCKRLNPVETQQRLVEYLQTLSGVTAEMESFKAGSLSQVHRGVTNEKDEVVFKVLYHNIEQLIWEDYLTLSRLLSGLSMVMDFQPALQEIKDHLEMELDYKQEAANATFFREAWAADPDICIPKVYTNLSSRSILCLEYINGQSLPEFLLTADQDSKNHVGKLLVKFTYGNFMRHHKLYADLHWGNFLIMDDLRLGVVDFGCTKILSEEFTGKTNQLYHYVMARNKPAFLQAAVLMGIIEEVDEECPHQEYLYKYFQVQFEPWLDQDEFVFDDDYLERCTDLKLNEARHWKLPADLVLFHRITFGLNHILAKLNCRGNFSELIYDLIGEIPPADNASA